MKYLLYGIILMILYRLFFKQTIVIEHRHFDGEGSLKKRIKTKNGKGNDDDYIEYEEVK
jgi:hypothetical protein